MKKLILILCVITLTMFPKTVSAETDSFGQESFQVPAGKYTSVEQLKDKRIAVKTGSNYDAVAQAQFRDGKLFYFNSTPDEITALKSGKVDTFLIDEPIVLFMMGDEKELTYIPEALETYDYAFAFPKTDSGKKLCDELSEYIRQIRADGTLDQILNDWLFRKEENWKVPDYEKFPATNGELTFATDPTAVPFSIMYQGEIMGADIVILANFCKANGYRLHIKNISTHGLIPAVQSGKVDFVGGGLSVTAERKESVLFSEPHYTAPVVFCVLKEGVATEDDAEEETTGFLVGIRRSFEKTFLREDRWKLFVEGFLTTLYITFLSILIGTVLGFIVFMLCRNGNRAANGITHVCLWLVKGMPTVVLLMIFYYIIFGSLSIGGTVVSVICFTLIFGAGVFGLLKMGVGAVDPGQREAAYALGYSNRRTFFKVILPQALPHVISPYKGEVTSLIKATSVVGYIAVQDLTKMGDLVRSRTFEAFFPLISIAIIYFALEFLLGFIIDLTARIIIPKKRRREKVLKGITAGGQAIVKAESQKTADEMKAFSNIRIEHLKKKYPDATPLKDVCVEIHEGDVISIIGPSGTGKSTLLRCINQLEKPTSGRIWMGDLELTAPKCNIEEVRQKMGMVFQSFNLFGHKTVIENIMMAPMDLLGKSKQEAYDTGMRLLRMVGLAEKALNYPDELSGGQKQRIAITRTLAMDPEIILLDEPTSALDPTMVGEVQAVIRELAKTGKTMMIVTHEMAFARAICNRVFYMDEGGVYEDGTPEQVFDHPQKENTRRFVRKLKVLELEILNKDYDFLGMATMISNYCRKNQVNPILENRTQLIFEELVGQLLINMMETTRIHTVMEYSETLEQMTMIIRFSGPQPEDIRNTDNLSVNLLKTAISTAEYSKTEDSDMPNQLILHVRNQEDVSHFVVSSSAQSSSKYAAMI